MSPVSEIDQKAMINGLIAGDDDAWRKFLAEIVPIVNAVCFSCGLSDDEVDEVGQILAMKLLENNCRILRQFKPGDGSFFGWVKVIVSRIVLDIARKTKRRIGREDRARMLGTVARELEIPTDSIEAKVSIEKIVGELSQDDRSLFSLLKWDTPRTEIARIFGIDKDLVHKRVERLKSKLRDLMEKYKFDVE